MNQFKRLAAVALLGWQVLAPGIAAAQEECVDGASTACQASVCRSIASDVRDVAILRRHGATIGDLLKSNIDSRSVSVYYHYDMDRLTPEQAHSLMYRICMDVTKKHQD